jgi:two-component system cell cycle sensor histidine kinase/response regulator CckA
MPEATQTGGGKRVLVVDDEDLTRQTITRMLEAGGFTVVTATNGAEALEYLSKRSADVDIVLSDVTMPEMNGIDLSYHIRDRYPRMPVAIVSGDVSDLEKSIIGRADVPFIKNPFHAEALYSAVREAIRRQSPAAGK